MGNAHEMMRDDERAYGEAEDIEAGDRSPALKQFRTATSVSMTPELFEKLYMAPMNKVSGHLRSTFGNPSPIGTAGFLLCLTPLSIDHLGWGGATGKGFANLGAYFFQGGILMNFGCILEWIIGNTFPAVVFGVYGTFWIAYAATLSPSTGSYAFYAPPDAKSPLVGLTTPGFNAGQAWWIFGMGLMTFMFFICSLRLNLVFCGIFFCLSCSFALDVGALLLNASNYKHNTHLVHELHLAGGAFTFAATCFGWYSFFATLLASVDFPVQLKVGDLSHVFKGKSQRAKERRRSD